MFLESGAFAEFAEGSYSWRFIERPAFDRALPPALYTPSARILDVGSGPGRVVAYHMERGAQESNITGIEPDETSVETARQRFPKASFVVQKAQEAQLATGSLDIITAQLTLRYFDNAELSQLFNKVSLALAQGGRFFMLDVHPARYGMSDGFDQYFEEGLRTVAIPWRKHEEPQYEEYYYRTIGTYVRALAAAGLHVIHLDECPIADAGTGEEFAADYAKYSVSPARLAIAATPARH